MNNLSFDPQKPLQSPQRHPQREQKGSAHMKQYEAVYKYMEDHGSITPFEACMDLKVIDLARTISYMRKIGYNDIVGTEEKTSNQYSDNIRYYRYSIRKENANA